MSTVNNNKKKKKEEKKGLKYTIISVLHRLIVTTG